MKKNKLLLRVLALCLTLACTFSLAAVAADSNDTNQDGIVNVWDVQIADVEDKTTVLSALLGGGDELHPNAQGEYEIYSQLGLRNMAKLINNDHAEGVTFKLMRDVDMQGAMWQSTDWFSGTFEGNGHVISNVNVVGEIALNAEKTSFAQGFFGKVARAGTVRNLKLENVTNILTTESKARYVGLLTGSLLGELNNCTTVGTVIDPRTTLTADCYIGTLCGRVENVTDNPARGITIDDENILMTAETPEITAISGKSQPVLCKMGMDFAALSDTQYKRQLGIAGTAPKAQYNTFGKYNWQDISGATTVVGGTGEIYNLQDEILIARREAVVAKMYENCTVEWTPSQNMTLHYYKVTNYTEDGIAKSKLNYYNITWTAGNTYRGVPYNHGSGSLERFKEWMQDEKDSSGRLVTKTELPTTAYYYTYSGVRTAMSNYTDTTLQTPLTYTDPNNGNKVYDLLPGYQLSDQPMKVGETVESADHAGFSRYIGNDCSQAIQWAWREVVSSDVKNGGTVISGVTQMTPTTEYQSRFGVRAVGGLVPTEYSVSGWCETYDNYGKTAILDAYAQASKGDAIIVDQPAGGHSRMVAYDPICIRDAKGVILLEEDTGGINSSYIITHEQGSGSSAKDENGKLLWSSTCHVNRVHMLESLLDEADHTDNSDETECNHYYPMTIPAFHDVDNKAVTSTVSYKNGVVSSNFYILSTTVDDNEVFTAIGQHNGVKNTASYKSETLVGPGYREAQLTVDLAKAHGDVAGKTVTVRLSNGDLYTVNADTGAITAEKKTDIR